MPLKNDEFIADQLADPAPRCERGAGASQPKQRRRFCRIAARIGGVVLLLWLSGSFVFLYWGMKRAKPPFAEPAPDWGQVESQRIPTDDGEEIGAWFFPGEPKRPVVLMIHGNGGSRTTCLPEAEELVDAGYGALLITMRAHGDSTGNWNDFGYGGRNDVIAAVHWLQNRFPDRPILVYGRSAGAAAATYASAELKDSIRGYLLECPYRDLRRASWNRLEMHLPPVLDQIGYAGLYIASVILIPYIDKVAPIDAVAGIPADVPVLILAGGADEHTRTDEAQAIYERVRSHARVVIFEGAAHLCLRASNPKLHSQLLLEFAAASSSKVDQ